ncbi:carotenoid 1,2-hydratase [Microvirga tunisiensis]|uniref:Carotenoid 1,2-hydratase n=1 Tax=Pannonibacter tanglangensis TaxID=2750084 RepID=A0A7X5EYY8_9HYPH|nr:carotenoid 1,2-hydratase [Pannonibacter sp. XCT-53]
MIVFIGSVFSPYYHWSGRRAPENHVAVNVALYGGRRQAWAMTERSRQALARKADRLVIGRSSLATSETGLTLDFDEIALPWPGQRLWPARIRGRLTLVPALASGRGNARSFDLDPAGHHIWMPVFPRARITVESDSFPEGGWQGEAYHDFNAGDRPLETDFLGWDWARGVDDAGVTRIVYDAVLRDGGTRRLGLVAGPAGTLEAFDLPDRQPLPRGGWGVRGGIPCDGPGAPERLRKLEDTPFYTRSLVRTQLQGTDVSMVHETLDCRRLSSPVVRLMLPFRMPRAPGHAA